MKVKFLNELAQTPTKGSKEAAGWDLYAAIPEVVTINPHETVKIGTGLAIELPNGTFGAIFARSGLATKQGLRPANCVGVVDSDYRGEVIVAIHNDSNEIKTINPGDRIAQLIISLYVSSDFEIVDELDGTDRGENGFGSTGT